MARDRYGKFVRGTKHKVRARFKPTKRLEKAGVSVEEQREYYDSVRAVNAYGRKLRKKREQQKELIRQLEYERGRGDKNSLGAKTFFKNMEFSPEYKKYIKCLSADERKAQEKVIKKIQSKLKRMGDYPAHAPTFSYSLNLSEKDFRARDEKIFEIIADKKGYIERTNDEMKADFILTVANLYGQEIADVIKDWSVLDIKIFVEDNNTYEKLFYGVYIDKSWTSNSYLAERKSLQVEFEQKVKDYTANIDKMRLEYALEEEQDGD